MLMSGFPICHDFISLFYMWLIVVLRQRLIYLKACNDFAMLNWDFKFEKKKKYMYVERANDLNTYYE